MISCKACRIRARAPAAPRELFESIKRLCAEHRGSVPLFVHLLLPDREVVVRVRAVSVNPTRDFLAKVEELLGRGSILAEYADRA